MATPDYSAWNTLLNTDYFAQAKAGSQLLTAGNLSGAYLAWDQANRDNVLAGVAPIWFATYYPFPPTFVGTPPLQVPYTVAVPPLSASQLAMISIQAAPPPATPPPATTPPATTTPGSTTPATTTPGTKIVNAGSSSPVPSYLQGPGFSSIGSYCDSFPDDPLCQAWTGGSPITIIGGGGGNTSFSESIYITEGISSVDVDAIVDGSLNGLWRAAVDAVDAATAAIAASVQDALTGIANALKAAYNALARLSGFILKLLGTLWNDIVKGIVGALHAVEKAIGDLYNDVLKPVAKAMQDVRNWLLKLYKNWIRPLLIILQDIRKVLAILKLFHVKFAGKLDSAIADVQAKIMQPIFWLLTYTNAVANWINLIVTASYLLQQPLFLGSLKAYAGGAINLQLGAMNQPLSPAGAAAIAGQPSTPPAAQSVSELKVFLASTEGPVDQYANQYGSLLEQTLGSVS